MIATEEEDPVDVATSGTELDKNPQSQSMTFPPATPQDDELSVAAIIGIAFGTVLILLIIFYCESRRRMNARQVGITSQASSVGGNNRKSTLDEDGSDKEKGRVTLASASVRKSVKSSKPRSSPLEDVKEAINNADWDNVYRLASQLAEEDDLSLSSVDVTSEIINRNHLSREDQDRTMALDELMAKGDWTGLAVTAALYAGESGTSHIRRSKDSTRGSNRNRSVVAANRSFKDRMTTAVADGDWKKVQAMSHEIEKMNSSYQMSSSTPAGSQSSSQDDIEQGQASMENLVGGLSSALNAGDWAQVKFFANRIKDEKGYTGANSVASGDLPETKAIVLADGFSKISLTQSNDSSDTDMSKKRTIEKLVKAQKWRGVSIMANLYEMESKQNAPVVVRTNKDSRSTSLSTYPSQSSSSRQRSSRTSSNIKELQYSDRVEENIVGFRQEES